MCAGLCRHHSVLPSPGKIQDPLHALAFLFCFSGLWSAVTISPLLLGIRQGTPPQSMPSLPPACPFPALALTAAISM